jgi:general secretion pathway protein I
MSDATKSTWTGSAAGSRSSGERRRARRGFTLIEVLVAFTILAVAMVAVIQAFSTGLRGLSAAEATATAVMHARAKLDEVGVIIALEPGEHEGAFDDGFAWHAVVRPHEVAEELATGVSTYEVEVTVSWDEGRRVRLQTLRLGQAP